MKLRILLVLMIVLCVVGSAFGQKAAVKTNLLYGATTTPNLALELGLGRHVSLEIAGGYNNWTLGKSDWANGDNKQLSHWLVMPGLRYWFCERFAGSFFGLHMYAGEFNIQQIGFSSTMRNNRHDGWLAGAGVSFGHQWLLSRRWALETELGAGYAYISYERYGCRKCDPISKKTTSHYFGPTRVSISLAYYLW